MAESPELNPADRPVSDLTPATPRPRRRLPFLPERFFVGHTDGAGVVRDPFGRIVRRCRVVTDGVFDAPQSVVRFEEVFSYDDGQVDVWRWAMTAGVDGRYVAAEAKAGAGITGVQRGDDHVLTFRRPTGRLAGLLAPRYRVRLTMLSADMALERAAVSLLGLPLGVLTAIHRRVGQTAPQ